MSDQTPTPAPPRDEAPEPARDRALSKRKRSRNWFTVGAWVLFIAACLIFPGSPANGIIFCPFRAITSLSCPGCGMTRSCTAAVRFDWWTSIEFHPLGILLILSFGGVAAWRLVENLRGEEMPLPRWFVRLRDLGYIALLVFTVLFGGARLVVEIAGILTQS